MSKTLSEVKLNKKRWAAYAAAGVAATFAGTQSAEADITHVVVGPGAGDLTIPGGTYVGTLNAFGGTATLLAGVQAVPPGGVGLVAVLGGTIAGFVSGGFPYASNLATGVNISTLNFGTAAGGLAQSQTATLAYGNGYGGDQFLSVGGFVAFQFNGGTQWGWAEFSVLNGAPNNEYVLEQFAYSDGKPIAVGQTSNDPGVVPEPTSLGLLALGAIGVMAHRRRKQVA